MRPLISRRRALYGGVVLAVALTIALGAKSAVGTGPGLTTVSAGPVPSCSDALNASLPYHVRQPSTIPAGLIPGRCEIAGTPGTNFARRTQFFVAVDRGWITVTVAPRGATVSLAQASTTQLSIGTATAVMGVTANGGAQIEGMYWDDGDVAIVINAMLSPTVTTDLVEQLARSLR
jgi:hypothetical protein